MKLFKYMLFIVILIFSIVFIIKLNELNTFDQGPLRVKIPGIQSIEGINPEGIKVWEAVIFSLSIGVFIGFIIALFQMIAQKTEIISLKSNIRRLKNELDNLRNNAIEDDVEIVDEVQKDTRDKEHSH